MFQYNFATLGLESGQFLSPGVLAWSQYGQAPKRARHVYMLLHGITSSPQAFLGDPAPALDAGWFQAWTPGVFDLAYDCVLAPNALGSCFGSSSPQPAAPAGDFPLFTIVDTVNLYAQWLEWLCVSALDGVIGYSYGGYQAFQWALNPPVPTGKAVVLASGPAGNGTQADVDALWNLALRFDLGDVDAQQAWRTQRFNTLKNYGYADWLAETEGRPDEVLKKLAALWASRFPPRSLACLRQAAATFNVQDQLRTKVGGVPILWMVNSGDRLFPTNALCVHPQARLERHTICGRFGHSSPILEPELWTPLVHDFLRS